MKVLMICTEKLPVPPILGGAIQTYISGILPYLSKKHEITILGTNHPTLPNEETIDNVRYVRIPGKVFEVYKDGVSQYVAANQFDLIHIFNRPRLVLPVRQSAPNTKITLSMHNDMFFPEKIDPEEASMALQQLSKVVTVSDYIGNVIKELFPAETQGKVRTIYSGVDIGRFLPKSHSEMKRIRDEIRKAHGLEGKTVILFSGRLSRNKGVDRLVRAMPELSKRFPNIALVIMGGNWFSENRVTDYVAYVRAVAKKLPIPVITTGFVSPDKIQDWYGAADLFVCTSQWQEPLARVHYEAMAAGLPIVTTARGGNPEVIIPKGNGVVIENPEDPNNFVEVISEVLSNPALMRKMGSVGREIAQSRYTWDRVALDVLSTWDEVSKLTTAPAIGEMPTGENATQTVSEQLDKPEKVKEKKKKRSKEKEKLELQLKLKQQEESSDVFDTKIENYEESSDFIDKYVESSTFLQERDEDSSDFNHKLLFDESEDRLYKMKKRKDKKEKMDRKELLFNVLTSLSDLSSKTRKEKQEEQLVSLVDQLLKKKERSFELPVHDTEDEKELHKEETKKDKKKKEKKKDEKMKDKKGKEKKKDDKKKEDRKKDKKEKKKEKHEKNLKTEKESDPKNDRKTKLVSLLQDLRESLNEKHRK